MTRRAFRTSLALGALVLALEACAHQPSRMDAAALAYQHEQLEKAGVAHLFKRPEFDGRPTVSVGTTLDPDEFMVNFDPRFVVPDEVREAARVYCTERRGGLSPQVLSVAVDRADPAVKPQTVGTGRYLCAGTSVADASKVAQRRQDLEDLDQARRETQRRASLERFVAHSREQRQAWDVIMRQDRRLAMRGMPDLEYVGPK